MNAVVMPTDAYPFKSLAFSDYDKPVEYEAALEAQGTTYGLGAKADPLGCDISTIHAIDCSGFVRDALFRALGDPGDYDIPDGSTNQHQWAIDAQLKASTYDDALDQDNLWRIGFLVPSLTTDGIGHVLLIRNGTTYESHGGQGPGSRQWGSMGFMHQMNIFVLALPPTG